jgi:hypothetical protein
MVLNEVLGEKGRLENATKTQYEILGRNFERDK